MDFTSKPFVIFMALFGALACALNARREKRIDNWLDFFTYLVIAAFAGFIFWLVGIFLWGQDSILTGIVAGMGGWLGVDGLAFLAEAIKRLLGRFNFKI